MIRLLRRNLTLRATRHAPSLRLCSNPATCSRLSIAQPIMPLPADLAANRHHSTQTQTKTPLSNGNTTAHTHVGGKKMTSGEEMDVESQDLAELCAKVHERVEAFLQIDDAALRPVQEQSRVSLGVIAETLERYSHDELSLSYNGGKDCLVLLILYLSALHTHLTTSQKPTPLPPKLRTIYILSSHPFPEVDVFVASSIARYHLSLSRYPSPMQSAFAEYLSDIPSVRAIFVGTRRTDPHGAALTHFDPTDNEWPRFMRVHPVIDWHYQDVWVFIRALGVEYCRLYDLGYTSLGGTTDTHPNPALLRVDGGEEGGFRPAYELMEDGEERLGRDR